MDRKTRSTMAMADAVSGWLATQPSGSAAETLLREQFEAVRAAFRTHAREFHLQSADAEALTRARNELRREIAGDLLRHIQLTATAARAEQRELADRYAVPDSSASLAGFAAAVEAILAAGRRDAATLAAHGLVDGTLDRLEGMFAEWTALRTRTLAARGARMAARVQQGAIAGRVRRIVKQLDAIIRPRIRAERDLLLTWISATNIILPVLAPEDEAPQPGPGEEALPAA